MSKHNRDRRDHSDPTGFNLNKFVMCGRSREYIGIYVPARPRDYGNRKLIPYALCSGCYKPDDKEWLVTIEDFIGIILVSTN